MPSASRNEKLEALLAAKYELEGCDEGEKAECLRRFDSLLTPILAEHPNVSRYEILEAIGAAYRSYKAARLRSQSRRETL
jgi:hypothetical protein